MNMRILNALGVAACAAFGAWLASRSAPAVLVTFAVVFAGAMIVSCCSARADRRRSRRRAVRTPASRAAWPEPSARDHAVYSSMTHLQNVEEWRSCGRATTADVREARDALHAARRAAGPAASRAAYRRFHHIGRS